MNKESAESNANFLADIYRQELQTILEKSPIENLEEIRKNFAHSSNSALYLLIDELLEDLKAIDGKSNSERIWESYSGLLWHEISHFQQNFLENLFIYNLLQAYFVSNYTPLEEDYRAALLKKHKLTAKKLKDLLLTFLGNTAFFGRIKHGGKESSWDEEKRLRLLEHYNRFSYVIKNVRSDYKQLKKRNLSDVNIWKQIQEKYEIPQECIQEFSMLQSNSDLALSWTKRELQINDSNEHLRNRILRKARTENKAFTRNREERIIVGVRVNEDNVRSLFYVDPKNKRQIEELRYTQPKPRKE